MNELVEKNLSDLVEELTISGSLMLNEEKIKQLKQICKQAEINVEYCYRLLHAQLNKNHSEIRYSTFQIIDQLFHRSHRFRELLLDDFNYVIDKTLGLDVDHQLPPPKPTARLLRQFTATSIKKWHEKFGITYKLLDIGFNYLKNCKLVNFDNIEEPIGITAELNRQREEATRIRLQQKFENVQQEMDEISAEIPSCIKQTENCLDLLVPSSSRPLFSFPSSREPIIIYPKNDKTKEPMILPSTSSSNHCDLTTSNFLPTMTSFIDDEVEDDDDDDDDDNFIDIHVEPKVSSDQEILQLLGLGSAGKLNLVIDINQPSESSTSQIQPNDDNQALIDNLHDLYRQLNDIYLSKIQNWIKTFVKVQQSSSGAQISSRLKGAIELKNSVQACLKRIESYKMAPKRITSAPKLENKVKVTTPDVHVSGSSSAVPMLTENEIKFFFDGDLKCLKRSVSKPDVENPFIRASDLEEVPENVTYSSLMRTKAFVHELPPIKWKCRAPLGNGKFCERMDRYKCPFHGRIVARDEHGQAADMNIRKQEEETKRKRAVPSWEDPELLNEIRVATGVDLNADHRKKKQKKSKKVSGLSKINSEENSIRKRLEKKILNKSSLKRIGASMEADERRLHAEKFHHQFNYALKN